MIQLDNVRFEASNSDEGWDYRDLVSSLVLTPSEALNLTSHSSNSSKRLHTTFFPHACSSTPQDL